MAAKPIPQLKIDAILVDWRVGTLSQQDIAEKHSVSKGAVNKICKGIARDGIAIVTAGIEYRQALAGHDDRMMTAIENEVEERVKYINFFTNAAIRNTQEAMKSTCENQNDFKARADTIAKGREVVLGKIPDTIINNTNAQQNNKITYEVIR